MRKQKKANFLLKIKSANMLSRVTAFLMDVILIMSFVTLVVIKILIPQNYASEYESLESFINSQQAQGYNFAQIQHDITELDPKVNDMLAEIQGIYLLAFWIYFAGTEIFMQGSSLGKKIFRIRVISTRSLGSPHLLEVFLRSGMKALTIQTLFPLLLLNYIIAFFTRQKQAGHDFLARTVVVEDAVALDCIEAEDLANETENLEEN